MDPVVSSGQMRCPVPGGWNLSVTGHRGHVMTWGFLCVLVSWLCPGVSPWRRPASGRIRGFGLQEEDVA